MAHILFRPLEATHSLDVGKDPADREERIHMTVIAKLNWEETLELEDGTSMKGKTWSFGISRKNKGQETELVGDISQETAPIGEISYSEPYQDPLDERFSQPEFFFAEIEVDDREFESLLTSVRTGKATPNILVNVSGLDYGFSPDGDNKIWRNKTSPNLPVTSASFTWPLGKFEVDDEQSDDDGSLGNSIPEDQSKIPVTVGALHHATDTINKSLRLVAWMIAGLIVAVIIF